MFSMSCSDEKERPNRGAHNACESDCLAIDASGADLAVLEVPVVRVVAGADRALREAPRDDGPSSLLGRPPDFLEASGLGRINEKSFQKCSALM